MALRTTTTNGLWTSGSTWIGGVAPVSNDRVAIAHAVTIDSAVTIGASAGSDLPGTGTIGNAGGFGTSLTGVGTAFTTQLRPGDLISVGGSIFGVVASIASDTSLSLAGGVTLADGSAFTFTPAAIYLAGTGARLIVNAPLTVRGALVPDTPYTSPAAAVTVAAGVGIEFDASTAPDPANTHYPWLLLATNYQSGGVSFAGTPGSRCYLRSNAGGGHAYVTTGPFATFGSLALTDTDVTRIGDATRDAFTIWPYAYVAVQVSFTGCLLDSCGRVAVVGPPTAGSTLQFLKCTWTNTLHGRECLVLNGGTGATDGTSDVRGCVFDKRLNLVFAGMTIGGPGPDDWNFFRAGYITVTSSSWTAFRNNLVEFGGDQNEGLGSAGDLTDCYILADASLPANPHYLGSRPEGPITLDGLVFEYDGADPTGDCVMELGVKLTLRRCLKLPNAAGLSSGTMVSGLVRAAGTIDVEHCTIHGGGSIDSSGVRLGETQIAAGGTVTSFRGNLYWDTRRRGWKLYTMPPGADPDAVAAANCDYNGGWLYAEGSNGKGYDGLTFSSGTPGVHDVTADPRFVWQVKGLDPTTTPNVLGLGGWDASLGGPGTVAHALAQLALKNSPGYDARYNFPALLAWVRGNFQPTNPAYAGTTYPGDPATADAAGNPLVGTVGALAYLQPASGTTLFGPARGVPGGASAPFTVTLAYGVNPGPVTITPHLSGFAGTFTPASVSLSNTTREATFTLTPAGTEAAGTAGSISLTNSGTLVNPDPFAYTLAYDPAPGRSAWLANMQWSATGQPNVYPPPGAPFLDGPDHYDPIRVFQNVRDTTGDPAWETQIAAAVHRYRDQSARPAGGNADPVHAWLNGLVRHYHDSGQVASRETGILIRRITIGGADDASLAGALLWMGSRELAFGILNQLGSEDLGYPPGGHVHDMVTYALGHVDQWTWGAVGSPYTAIGPRSPFVYTQCFMVGITCEALIAYWDRYGDTHVSGIPAKVRQALDWLWDNAYLPDSRAFPYVAGTPNANMLTTATGTVAAVGSPTSWSGDASLSPFDYVYSGNGVYPGQITFTSGAYSGRSVGLVASSGYTGSTRTFTVAYDTATGAAPTWAPGVGDAFTIKYPKFDVGTVATAADALHLTASPGLNANSGHYVFAKIQYLTGALKGQIAQVIGYDAPSGALTLYDPGGYLGGAPAPGDTFFLASSYGPEGADFPTAEPTTVLNLLIAPAYAWSYQDTARRGARDTTDRDRHDLLFSGSLAVLADRGDLGTQKQYNQQYRWSAQGLAWRDYGDIAWPAATHLRLSAPAVASGRANAWSGPFRIHISDSGDTGAQVGLGSADRVPVTLSDGGAGGTFAPAGPILTTDRGWATFRYRPAAGQAGTTPTISASGTGLTSPAGIPYAVSSTVAPTATGYAFTGPAAGYAGLASDPFALALVPPGSVPDATIDALGGVLAVANDDGSTYGGAYQLIGLDTPGAALIPLSGDNPAPQFRYTAPTAGVYTLRTYGHPAQAGDPQTLTYTASVAPPPPPPPPPSTAGRLRLRTAAGVLRLRVGSG
jgi:hypothetical protein